MSLLPFLDERLWSLVLASHSSVTGVDILDEAKTHACATT